MTNKKKNREGQKIPRATMERLPRYLMQLYRLAGAEVDSVSSLNLGESLGVKDTQIRKDLSYFGVFGKARYGYNVQFLIKSLETILGLNRQYSLAIIGMGNMGKSLSNYSGHESHGFHVTHLFDNAENIVGTEINGVKVKHVDKLKEVLTTEPVDIGIITVPEHAASDIAEALVDSGVKAIYNFTPAELQCKEGVYVENVYLSYGLFKLAHKLSGDWPRKK